MEKYWINLYPEVFLWLKNGDGLIYNAKEGVGFQFKSTGRIDKICRDLLTDTNLYTTELDNEDLLDVEVQNLMRSVTKIKAGCMIDGTMKRPVSLFPAIKIQDDISFLISKHKIGEGGSIIKNIHELTFYLNGSEWGSDIYFLQTIFPLKTSSQPEPQKILSFINNSRNFYLSNINWVGDFFSYPQMNELFTGLQSFNNQNTWMMKSEDFLRNIDQIEKITWPPRTVFTLLVERYADLDLLSTCLSVIQFPVSISCLVFSERDLNFVIKKSQQEVFCDKLRIIPIYKDNDDFFKKNVYLNSDDLLESILTKKEIFIRQALNINYFGKLIVFSDGNVYANVHEPLLGTINDSPYSIVYKEITEGKSWFRTRRLAPCNDCIYQWLCPSPSNYETMIGRTNLCHVSDSK